MMLTNMLDTIDLQIISSLQENGRRPTSEIARFIDVPESTVRRRIERLLRSGLIQVIALVRDPQDLGLTVHALLSMRVAPVDTASVVNRLSSCAELRWIVLATGSQNLRAEGFFRSLEHLNEFYSTEIASDGAIQDAELQVILDLYKNRYDWDSMMRADTRINVGEEWESGRSPRS